MIKLVSINIECSKHLDLVLPFLEKEKPDVVCIQELMEGDIPVFENTIGPIVRYSASMLREADGKVGNMGIGVFTRLPVRTSAVSFYAGDPQHIPRFDPSTAQSKHDTERHSVIFCDVISADEAFRIATTHFTWTPHGEASDDQRRDMEALLVVLDEYKQFVLCGDLNAPRGGEIFAMLDNRFHDNIPLEYKTSIDVNLHHARTTRLHEIDCKMVDGLFTTTDYVASNVKLVFGVSDHAAIVAHISRRVI